MKIGLIIPSTSTGKKWATFQQSYFYQYTLQSVLKTHCPDHTYCFYLGIDKGDPMYDNPETQAGFTEKLAEYPHFSIQFHYMTDIPKGHLTVMWNRLYDIAIEDECDLFVQCGDDIVFANKGWISATIATFEKTENIGVVGPRSENLGLMTQTIVTKRHKEIFGYYFPPEIKNWFCDNWINEVYRRVKQFYYLKKMRCFNKGGKPRYLVHNERGNFGNGISLKYLVDNSVKIYEQKMKIAPTDMTRAASPATAFKPPIKLKMHTT